MILLFFTSSSELKVKLPKLHCILYQLHIQISPLYLFPVPCKCTSHYCEFGGNSKFCYNVHQLKAVSEIQRERKKH